MVKIQNETVATRLLELMEQSKEVSSAGDVRFQSGSWFRGWQILLGELTSLHPEVPHIEKTSIIWSAIVDSARSGTIDLPTYSAQLSKHQSAYLSKRPVRFTLITSLSLVRTDSLSRFGFGSSTVTFPQSLPSRFRREREELLKDAREGFFADPPTDYRLVKVSVDARSDAAAAKKALDLLNFLRALWNLYIHQLEGTRHTMGPRRDPVNKIILGPFHTVHNPGGLVQRPIWWYEPDYCAPISPYSMAPYLQDMKDFVSAMRARLSRIPYRHFVETMLRRYSDALDSRDWSSSFLRLWQVLEAATNTGQNDNHKVTVRRAAFINDDSDLHAGVLDCLRLLRNQMIHEGQQTEAIENQLYLLKRYVELMLIFHINRAGKYRNLEEVSEFLDLPPNPQDLKRRISLYREGMEFRTD